MYLDEIMKRKRINTPSSMAATPITSDIVLAEATRRAQVNNQVKAGQDMIALRGREMGDDARLSQEWMDTGREQANIATGIELANLGLAGYRGYNQQQVVKQQETARLAQEEQMNKNLQVFIAGHAERMKGYDAMIKMFSGTTVKGDYGEDIKL
ncbi:MAG: hypothetical protein ABIL06_13305 [Pseudomonadota bacterium]|uniref:Uncharacterized protein n=1 Tax=viral metagenome TaxID=1070528 RepID=A0A6H1ZHV1_9ZZZZ